MRAAAATANAFHPNLLPSPAEIFEAYTRERLTPKQAIGLLKLNGVSFDPEWTSEDKTIQRVMRNLADRWFDISKLRNALPSLSDLYALRNRGALSATEFEQHLKWMGYADKSSRDHVEQLRYQVAQPSDLVRFALREVWDDDVAETWGYDEEFRPEFDAWMRRQGFQGDARFDAADIARMEREGVIDPATARDLRGKQGAPLSWARAYHRASWDVLSPTMGYEAFHRLRPKRLGRIEEFLNSNLKPGTAPVKIEPFTLDTLFSVLKVADYPSRARAWLAGISAAILTRVDIKRMLSMDAITSAEVYEQMLDRGYVPADARLLTDFAVREVRIQKGARVRSDTKAKVIDAYKTGSIDHVAASLRLYRLGLTDPDQLAIFDRLPAAEQWRLTQDRQLIRVFLPVAGVTTQEITLHSNPLIPGELALVDADWASVLQKKAIAAQRKCLLSGRQNEGQTRNGLILLNVQPARIDQYLRLWRIEFDCGRKEMSTRQIIRLAREGLLTPAQVDARLVNLGWDDDDRRVLMAEVQRNVNLEFAKAQAKAARTVQQQQAALQRAATLARQEQERLAKQLTATGTPTNLHRWYVRGTISGNLYRARLAALGWPIADIDRELIRAEQDRIEWNTKQEEKRRKAAQQAQSNGSATGPSASSGDGVT
jgi:hypothetical protein